MVGIVHAVDPFVAKLLLLEKAQLDQAVKRSGGGVVGAFQVVLDVGNRELTGHTLPRDVEHHPLLFRQLREQPCLVEEHIELRNRRNGFVVGVLEAADRARDDPALVIQEVSQVHIIGFGVEVAFAVLDGRSFEQGADGNVTEGAEALLEHEPIEQRPRHPAITVLERMLEADGEVQDDRLDQRVHVVLAQGIGVVLVDPIAQGLQPSFQPSHGRRLMHDLAEPLDDHIVGVFEGAGAVFVIVDALYADLVQFLDQLWGQRFVAVVPGETHHAEIADDHFFIDRARAFFLFQQFFGGLCGGGRAFQLAAADGLVFDQVVQEILQVLVFTDVAAHPLQGGCGGLLVAGGDSQVHGWRIEVAAADGRVA